MDMCMGLKIGVIIDSGLGSEEVNVRDQGKSEIIGWL